MKQQKGFTLVEAAVAIGVVAILSGIIIPLVMKNLSDAKDARAKNEINVIVGALASLMRDTATRPTGAGPAGSTGAGQVRWYSSGTAPIIGAGGGAPRVGAQTFNTLFASTPTTAGINGLFGLGAINQEYSYKGPYLSPEAANKSDPWGNAYVILGFNHDGKTNDSPIWVVSAGSSGVITVANDPNGNGVYGATWNYDGLSHSNLAKRVN